MRMVNDYRLLWRRSLLDTRACRGADVASDHHLVVATAKLKLKMKPNQDTVMRKFDIGKLKTPEVKACFVLE